MPDTNQYFKWHHLITYQVAAYIVHQTELCKTDISHEFLKRSQVLALLGTVETEVSHEIRFLEAINYYLYLTVDSHKTSKLQLMRLV